jgi:hypothetical protein
MTQIGPYPLDRIVLCSPDAGPNAQATTGAHRAADLFPQANWVRALQRAAEDTGCGFAILTRAYGAVRPDDTVWPYDLPLTGIRSNPELLESIWRTTIPRVISTRDTDIVVFYCGGFRNEDRIRYYLPVLTAIYRHLGVDLLTFGEPLVFDLGRARGIVTHLAQGTTADEIKHLLTAPSGFEFYPASR